MHAPATARTLERLNFDNRFARLGEPFSVPQLPTPLRGARLLSFNPEVAALLEIDPSEAQRPQFAASFSGALPIPGAEPVAMLYAGHQFGYFVPQLGDGRAILLGQVRNATDESYDLHLKGAGQTPFSRGGDGRAVLRSSIREYLCGEAMHALGIPTTRTLCLLGSDEPVVRETVESGAAIVRVAASHVRFGSFEVFQHRGQHDRVRTLADHVIAEHFPHLAGEGERRYPLFFHDVVRRTAELVAAWQAVGFAHGVLNTDNMSILGLTLDYGPFGFMERYDPGFICNHSDHAGRYAFDQQPAVGLWNLQCLAYALSSLVSRDDALAALESYQPAILDRFTALMRTKLGLAHPHESDEDLLRDLLRVLSEGRVDYTQFFRALSRDETAAPFEAAATRPLFAQPAAHEAWLNRFRERVALEGANVAARRERMLGVNPKFVLRNSLAQAAIERAEAGDIGELERLLAVLRRPYDEHPEREAYALPDETAPPIVVSCSS